MEPGTNTPLDHVAIGKSTVEITVSVLAFEAHLSTKCSWLAYVIMLCASGSAHCILKFEKVKSCSRFP